MKAIVATPGTRRSARLEEIPEPHPGAGQVRLETLYLGIDGTDREIDAGAYGAPPDGSSYLVLGHEAVCRVDGIGEEVDGLARGDLVVPVVRRPCPENCLNCRAGEADRCITGHYREHGIFKLHGFASEYALSDAQYVVKIPPDLLDVAVLLEPLSIAENALSSIGTIQKRMVWEPSRAFVIGAGPLGLLAAFLLGERGYEVSVAATRDAESPKARLVREMGGDLLHCPGAPVERPGPPGGPRYRGLRERGGRHRFSLPGTAERDRLPPGDLPAAPGLPGVRRAPHLDGPEQPCSRRIGEFQQEPL